MDYQAIFNKCEQAGMKKVTYRGQGTFTPPDKQTSHFVALYNYAEEGSILKVTNLMSKQSIYVKVIGKVPASDAQNDIILKLSSAVAENLKVTEDKFLVEVAGFNFQ
jgi:hypothetical protein